jgi:protoporphyrinogen oxidase
MQIHMAWTLAKPYADENTQHMKFLIIGAGPCGLAAAFQLQNHGVDWDLYEIESYAGGLSASFNEEGFTWDLGGHIVFSHYENFDEMLDRVIEERDWLHHQRQAYICLSDRWIPYPFQNHIHRLPKREREACLAGLRKLGAGRYVGPPANFQDWINRSSGEGIAELFMNPYNFKVWAHYPDTMSISWLGERVAEPDIEAITKSAKEGIDSPPWGPNSTFRFPASGGTGRIWRLLAEELPAARLHYNKQLKSVDCARRRAIFDDGSAAEYDKLISTIPLDRLVSMLTYGPECSADSLKHNSVYVAGIGVQGNAPQEVRNKSWMYFPEAKYPFYRVTAFSNYSPGNAPAGCYSLMAEVSESAYKPVEAAGLLDDCVVGLRNAGLIGAGEQVVHTWCRRLEYAYPVPCLERDRILSSVMPALEKHDIFSRGRFGAWKYEVGNMDHCYSQGLEIADRLVLGRPEMTVNDQELANGRKGR